MRSAIAPIYLGAVLIAGVLAAPADSHFKPGRHNVVHAINLAWCGRSNSYCLQAREARTVALCETGGTLSTHATNGQFLGLFQMGSYARSRYGHGWDPWTQARSAHRYYLDAGWSPWQCTPWGGLRW